MQANDPSQCPVALTAGDPAGVGPELATQILQECPDLQGEVIAIGADAWLDQLPTAVRRVRVDAQPAAISNGKPDRLGQLSALQALETAAHLCRQGTCRAVVSGPINKARLIEEGFSFVGQTEFFAARWGGTPVMAFSGEKLHVVLATWHIPLSQVAVTLNEPLLEAAVRQADWLARARGKAQPRIAVCGLNPHAGEEGVLGEEEKGWINPCLERLRKELPGLSDCQAADTVFFRQLEGEFDVVVALYHDQGLAPLKTLEFDRAAHLTLGLPWLRTSPDHGTAYSLAGKQQAKVGSFLRALQIGCAWSR